MDLMESSGDQAIVEERQKLVDSLDKLSVSAGSSSFNFKKPVTNDSGTGVVYAPTFGEDDYRVCLENKIIKKGENLVVAVDDDAMFTERITHFSGRYVRDADKDISEAVKVIVEKSVESMKKIIELARNIRNRKGDKRQEQLPLRTPQKNFTSPTSLSMMWITTDHNIFVHDAQQAFFCPHCPDDICQLN